ncbi:terpene synthase [Agathobacter sp.]|uniref:terpene synthase n=1 Tax=Agathobacter sp. TaxID=2021311 RepID=UPI00280C06CC|nr:terpene synthase [Agathobacter sp.]
MLTDILRSWGYEIQVDETKADISGWSLQTPAVKDCRFTQTSFGTVVHDHSGKWLGQYESEDAAVEMIREMAQKQEDILDDIQQV